MLSLLVWSVTGHFTIPGAFGNLGVLYTYECPPPSTVIGFLESLAGRPPGDFAQSGSTLAYGWLQRPAGRGFLLQRMQVRANQDASQKALGNKTEGTRPVHRECLLDFRIRVVVQGPYADLLRRALIGQVSRYGILSLGNSDDIVNWIGETQDPAEWLVPGTDMSLPIRVPRDYHKVQATMRAFTWSEPQVEVPTAAWMEG